MSKHATQKPPRNAKSLPRWIQWMVGGVLLVIVFSASTLALGAQMENNDQFCASCHTQPESTFVDRTQHPAVDLASAHKAEQVGCIACHSGEGVPGRLDALKLGARDLTAFISRHYPQPAQLTHAISDANCLKCHQDVGQGNDFNNHFHILLPRWQKADPQRAATCVSCHSTHTTDGSQQLRWLNKDRTVAQCNACHRTLSD